MNPFEAAREMAGLWERSGEAYFRAQSHLLDGFGEWMNPMTAGAERAAADTAGGTGQVTRAVRAFAAAWTAAHEAAGSARATIVSGEEGANDGLSRLIDPGAWLSPAALPGASAGPRPATDREVEGRIVALLECWREFRRLSLDHNATLLAAWTDVATAFTGEMRLPGRDQPDAGTTASLWVDRSARAFATVRRSDVFRASQDALTAAALRLAHARDELDRSFGEACTSAGERRREGLQDTVDDLRREVRALRRRLLQPAREPVAVEDTA